MRIITYYRDIVSKLPRGVMSSKWTFRKRFLVALIPPILIILVLTGYLTAWISNNYLGDEVRRTLWVQTAAIARQFESFFDQCQEDLRLLSQLLITQNTAVNFAKARKRTYLATAFIASNQNNSVFILNHKEGTVQISPDNIPRIEPNPLTLLQEIGKLPKGAVFFSRPTQATYPIGEVGGSSGLVVDVIRLSMPHFDDTGHYRGFFLLSFDVAWLMEILSEVRSPQSPLFGLVASPSSRWAYLLDTNGRISLSSVPLKVRPEEEPVPAGQDVDTEDVQSGHIYPPAHELEEYRKMVEDIRNGKHGTVELPPLEAATADSKSCLHGYAPIFLPDSFGDKKRIFGGVVLADRSNIALWAKYAHINLIFVIMLASTVLISAVIIAVSHIIARPIFQLAAAAEKVEETGKLEQITIAETDEETGILQAAINKMLSTLRSQMEEIKKKDEKIQEQSKTEHARLEEEVAALKKRLQVHTIEEIIGASPIIAALKSDIFQAASVDADVLVMGETGTGKQLVAEAIHKHSMRWNKPFISINCGALDENLLIDTLFGHTRGAFTGAKNDRKGAFVAAEGGTLFLDEIGCASPQVQQSLLTALSMRKIKHLGSDHEVDVDVRLIAATNLDLRELIRQGSFREDLYYRLEVLAIKTPPLRERKEDIPLLIHHFLKQATSLMNKNVKDFSKGAVEKMTDYHWPGNVRELTNCVTRAVAMAKGTLIQAHHITLGHDKASGLAKKYIITQDDLSSPHSPTLPGEGIPPGLNDRQKKAFPFLLQNHKINRARYQELAGPGLSPRTALYDLQDMVRKGILNKVGRGPATRYRLAESRNRVD